MRDFKEVNLTPFFRDWKAALNQFTIQFEGRLPQL